MASRTISTILQLRDQFTAPARKIAESTGKINKNIERENRRTINSVKKLGREIRNTATDAVKDVIKMTGAFTGIASTLALNSGFGEAMNMEGFKTQLETATKSAKKAGEIMKYSVQLANSTPFETGSIVEMSSMFESMGLSAKKWSVITADMAGATSKDVIQATEAMVDAVGSNEFERLKEFGIRKDQLILAATKKYGKDIVFNTKGQVEDQIKLQEVLMDVLQDKFKGGAAKQSKTLKGMWSTVTGVTKTSLAKIIGMQEDGTVRQGSMYEILKTKIQLGADILQKWQSDGTIQRIADNTVMAINYIIDYINKIKAVVGPVIKFTRENFDTIAPIIYTIVGAMAAYKTAIIAQTAFTKGFAIVQALKNSVDLTGTIGMNAMAVAQWALNAAMTANPIGMVIAGIAGVIAVGILLWKNFDAIKAKALELWDGFKNITAGIVNWGANLLAPIKPLNILIDKFKKIKDVGKKAWGTVKSFFGYKDDDKEEPEEKKPPGKINPGHIPTPYPVNYPVNIGPSIPNIPKPVIPKASIPNSSINDIKEISNQANNIKNISQNSAVTNNSSLTELNNETNNVSNESSQTNNISNVNNVDKSNVTNNNTSSTQSSSEEKIALHFHGDIYGFEDFKSKVAKSIHEIVNITGSNMVVVK